MPCLSVCMSVLARSNASALQPHRTEGAHTRLPIHAQQIVATPQFTCPHPCFRRSRHSTGVHRLPKPLRRESQRIRTHPSACLSACVSPPSTTSSPSKDILSALHHAPVHQLHDEVDGLIGADDCVEEAADTHGGVAARAACRSVYVVKVQQVQLAMPTNVLPTRLRTQPRGQRTKRAMCGTTWSCCCRLSTIWRTSSTRCSPRHPASKTSANTWAHAGTGWRRREKRQTLACAALAGLEAQYRSGLPQVLSCWARQ
jgi:hypothetical protein